MRHLTIAGAVALLLSAAAPAAACEDDAYVAEVTLAMLNFAPAPATDAASAKATSSDLSADEKKPMKKKVARHKPKMKKEKVEYMRAAPMPPGAK
jgi:hypothetical protein